MNEIEVDYMPIWRRYLPQLRASGLRKRELATLFLAMMEYQFEGKEPKRLSPRVQSFWAVYRFDLDHARARYESAVKNGKKGGRKKKVNSQETQLNPEKGISISESITESISKSITESKTESKTQKEQSPSAEAEVSVCMKTYGEFGWVRLSDQDYSDLQREMGEEQLRRCITYIDESAQSTGNRNHWMDWRTVLRRCYQKRWHEASSYGKQEIPKGASGQLGEAELEAIQRVLAT